MSIHKIESNVHILETNSGDVVFTGGVPKGAVHVIQADVGLKKSLLHEELVSEQLSDSKLEVNSIQKTLSNLSPDESRCDLYAILALIMRSTNEHKQAQREIRHAGYQALESIKLDEAQRIRDSADKRMWGSIAVGVGQVLGGAVSIVGLGQSILENQASEFDAQKAELEALERKQEQVTQEVNEHMQQQLDVIRDVLTKLGAIEQSRSEINREITRSL